ncbi:MAG: hypothetical protein ACLFNL_07045 [Bacteroidales bacterium]
MKTQNILKGIRLITFIIAGVFISLNISAGEPQLKDVKNTECCDGAIEEQNENSMELSDWMLKDENFVVKVDSREKASLVDQIDNEAPLQLEDWMMRSDLFMIEDDREFGKVESWMLDYNNFKVASEDNLAEIENWILNPDFWSI